MGNKKQKEWSKKLIKIPLKKILKVSQVALLIIFQAINVKHIFIILSINNYDKNNNKCVLIIIHWTTKAYEVFFI